jgi:hypothetical protein
MPEQLPGEQSSRQDLLVAGSEKMTTDASRTQVQINRIAAFVDALKQELVTLEIRLEPVLESSDGGPVDCDDVDPYLPQIPRDLRDLADRLDTLDIVVLRLIERLTI